MNTHTDIDSNETLLIRYFSGEATPEECAIIEQWLEASEENRQTGKDIYAIYLASDTLDTLQKTDTSQGYKEVRRRIGDKQTKTTFLNWVQRIAAILLIPICITFSYYITREEPVQYVEYQTNPGMIAKVELPDGSSVWLNSSSRLKHPQQFTGNTREVEIEGEAYFAVEKDASKRFIVHTPQALKAEVLGTEFNIEAYRESPEVITTLVSGSVRLLYNDKQQKQQEYTLQPDEEFTYYTQSKETKLNRPYVPTLTAWKEGRVILKNTPFEETLKILSKRFNVEFVVKNIKLYDNYFTYTSDSQQLSLFLDAFKISSGIQYRFVTPVDPGLTEGNIPKSVVELY